MNPRDNADIQDLSLKQVAHIKGLAICLMLLLHLFCTKDYRLYTSLLGVNNVPIEYYIGLFGDSCVAIFCFCSGFGLYKNFLNKKQDEYAESNIKRIFYLYKNLWIIIFLFVFALPYFLSKRDVFDLSFSVLALNITGIDMTYNGAWWFFTVYIMLCLSSSFLFRFFEKWSAFKVVSLVFLIYILAYIQRIKVPIFFGLEFVDGVLRIIALYGTSVFPFIIGYLFAKYNFYPHILDCLKKNVGNKYLISFFGVGAVLCLIIFHGYFQSLFWAPLIMIVLIPSFTIIQKPLWLDSGLVFLGEHSTNIWLTHMFYYIYLFKEIVFYPRYSFFIFIWLLILSATSSIIINKLRLLLENIFSDLKFFYERSR